MQKFGEGHRRLAGIQILPTDAASATAGFHFLGPHLPLGGWALGRVANGGLDQHGDDSRSYGVTLRVGVLMGR